MKKITYHLLSVLVQIVPCQLFAQNSFRLEAQVKNCPTPYAILYGDNGSDTISINDGRLFIENNVEKPYYATLMIPKVRMFLGIWIQNGKEAVVNLDAENPDEVVLTGSVQKESEFMKEGLTSMAKWRPAVSSFAEYEKAWQSLSDSILLKAKELGNQDFYHYQESYLQQMQQEKMSAYYQFLLQAGQKADADSRYNNFMSSLNIREISNSASSSILFNYLRWKAECRNASSTTDYYTMMQVLSEEINNQAVRDELAFRLFRLLLSSQDKSHAEEAYQLALRLTSQDVQQKIQTFYLSSSRPEGSEIPDFNVLDINEKPVSFKAICNKPVVYVDVWSTWCVPCCKEIPYVAKLVEKYKDNPNIKFVSVSIDKNRGNWKKFLAKQEDQWEQYLVPEDLQREFFNIFAINGIPRFMVFDGSGRIININEVRPSAENIEAILNGYIQK